MQNQNQEERHVDFCLEPEDISQDICEQEDKIAKQQHGYNIRMVKKYSINTASSNKDQDQDQIKSSSRFTEQQLKLTSIQLLERQNKCKISQNKDIFPSSFSLISLPQKKLNITLQQLMESNFSVLSYSIQQLINFSTQIIYQNKYAQKIYENKELLEELIHKIACNYNKISYHNFSHAFSLMQLNFQCLELMPSFKQHFTSEEIFYTFISGISHDLNHNGTNNMFEVKRKTPLALMYNNQSVLQNMHISMLWKILRENPHLNFLTSNQNSYVARQTITKLILSTDMSSHFKNLQTLQKRRKQNNIKLTKHQDRMFMMQQIFHSCDLGNPTLQYDSYISWAALLSHEFNQQVKSQKFYEVEVTKSFQYKNFTTLYNDQVWFVGKIVHPLWKQITLHLPELGILKRRIQQNTQKLNEKLTEQQLKART